MEKVGKSDHWDWNEQKVCKRPQNKEWIDIDFLGGKVLGQHNILVSYGEPNPVPSDQEYSCTKIVTAVPYGDSEAVPDLFWVREQTFSYSI